MLLTAACAGDNAESLDGGRALSFDHHPESVKMMSADPCWRREKGGWHLSTGHCTAMTRAEKMSGVWVTAFEETSFFLHDLTIPNPRDWRRFVTELELHDEKAHRLAGVTPSSSDGEGYLLSFIGRRTRDPYLVDCQGMPQHVVIVDRLLSARHLGRMASLSVQEFSKDLKARPVTVAHKHRGRWGEEEKEAIKRCAGRGT